MLEKQTRDIAEIAGAIHSIETCGTVDGPGIRYVIFTQGCPLRCQYCHNPDTWETERNGAMISTSGQLMADIIKYKSFMKFSGGGVTLSGGEPLMQSDFAAALFQLCKAEGIHTALDTSGFAPLSQSAQVFSQTDLVLLDIKSGNPGSFKQITGRDMGPVMETARFLSDKGIKMWIRFVLTPGLTDNEAHMAELAEFVQTLKTVERIDVLPFHKMGEYKWRDMGLEYKLFDTPAPTESALVAAKEIFRQAGLETN